MRLIAILFFATFIPGVALAASNTVKLSVPYTSEIPDGTWTKPWNNACEEASIVMVEQYYIGNHATRLSRTEAKKLMWPLFGIQDKLWKSSADTSATRTARLINENSGFSAHIVDNPTITDIEKEIRAGRPVISFHYGYDLKNPNIPWRRGGSSYHVMPITGYDNIKKEFIVDDPGNHATGLDYRYKYATIMGSLHDFDHKTGKANGPARVLFTTPKLAKVAGDPKVYLIKDGVKYHIKHSGLIKKHNWQWKWMKTVDADWMNSLPTGPQIVD